MPRQSLASPLKFSLVLTGFMLVFTAFWLQQTQQSVLAQDDGTAVPLLLIPSPLVAPGAAAPPAGHAKCQANPVPNH